MKAGSLQNLMFDSATDAAPEVGMGATVLSWTDRHPATVTEVSKSGHRVILQEDTAIRTDAHGMSDDQSYRFERDTNGRIYTATRRKDGTYRLVGGTQRVLFGKRDRYFDYSF